MSLLRSNHCYHVRNNFVRKKPLKYLGMGVGQGSGTALHGEQEHSRSLSFVNVLCPLLQGSDQQVVPAARLLSAQYFP
jgi:hypothetical protein